MLRMPPGPWCARQQPRTTYTSGAARGRQSHHQRTPPLACPLTWRVVVRARPAG
jgi:hypothetical protein